ncbi:MAG: cytochrome b/b6 domain-containing protein, partial [Microcoleaceae cyanobacterium]
MSQTQPYQPLLLRILHAGTAISVIGCLITGFLVYDSWDGRIFQLGLTTKNRDLIDIHGTVGVILFFIFIGFVLYSITAGKKRLITNHTWSNLTEQVGRPLWWVTLQRITN